MWSSLRCPLFSISEKISRWWQDCRAIHLKREALDMKTCFILSACDTAPFLWLEPVSIIQPISMLLLGIRRVCVHVCVLVHLSKRTRTFYSRSPPYPWTPSLPLDPLMRCDLSVGGPDCLSSFVLSFHPFLRSYLSALLQSIGLRALSVMVRDNPGSFDWMMCVLECVREHV